MPLEFRPLPRFYFSDDRYHDSAPHRTLVDVYLVSGIPTLAALGTPTGLFAAFVSRVTVDGSRPVHFPALVAGTMPTLDRPSLVPRVQGGRGRIHKRKRRNQKDGSPRPRPPYVVRNAERDSSEVNVHKLMPPTFRKNQEILLARDAQSPCVLPWTPFESCCTREQSTTTTTTTKTTWSYNTNNPGVRIFCFGYPFGLLIRDLSELLSLAIRLVQWVPPRGACGAVRIPKQLIKKNKKIQAC
ncbi:hypothetical protein LX32DRAFT_219255 [Colletotrichum zoysiae]|uniref:Uncharacterized protein n=1 Tax=Colletotrichum zoysiae TaxID=1216348 RepID=A0AAD9HN55_9PEZI|nr:hypothetical protein LX32DRAFT_219255 [Colletotrichum zoysiae]